MLRLSVEKIDERIAKLKELRKFAEDPDFVDLFQQCLSNNGHPPVPKSEEQEAPTKSKRGALLNGVLDVCRTFDGKFDTGDVELALDAKNFPINAKNHIIALNGALNRLRKKGQVSIAKKGSGRRPTKYIFNSDSDSRKT